MRLPFFVLFVTALVGFPNPARAAGDGDVPAAFAPVAFLIGTWNGVGNAEGTAGSGTDTFALDLGGRVLVRRAHSTYPGAAGAADKSYDGLMIIYPDASASGGLRADSFDSGGHTIRYELVPGSPSGVAQFLSDGPTVQPTFRLTYELHGGGSLDVKFEMAPPGSAAFATVAQGVDRRAL
jgi:hypothetical protein